jgi:hypothetical protein
MWKKNMPTRVTFLRFVIQAVAFAAIFYLLTYSIAPLTGGMPLILFLYVSADSTAAGFAPLG